MRKQLSIREKYRASADGYDELYAIEQSKKYSVVFPRLRPVGKILDAGCGTGLLEEYLASSGLLNDVTMVLCLDLTVEMLEKGWKKHRYKAFSGLIEYIEADIEHLPLRDTCVNQTYAFTVLNLLDDPRRGLSEIKRVTQDVAVYSLLKKACSLNNSCVRGLYLGETDKDIVDKIIKKHDINAKVEGTLEEVEGGVIIKSKEKGLLIDLTLKKMIEEAKVDFLSYCGL